MPIPTPPIPYVRLKSLEVDDEPTFAGSTIPVYNATTAIWTFSSQLVHDQQLGYVAEAFEKLFLQDFSNGSEYDSVNIDAALAPDGVTILNPGFEVTMQEASDAPSGFHLGSFITSVGLGWSIRTMIRVNLGVVVPPVYVP